KRGNQVEWACFDKNGKATTNQDFGHHMWRNAYDERGHATNTVYLGIDGQPTLTKSGYAMTTAKYDERGNRIEWACFGRDGAPTIDQSAGFHKWLKTYDERGKTTMQAYYAADGRLTQPTDDFPKVTGKYDKH